jgi:hypothetical protein
MSDGLAYISTIEVLVRHVGFASQFFSDLSQNFMPVATAEERVRKYLYREDLQLLNFNSPLRTLFAAQDLYQAYAATSPLSMTRETSSFQAFKSKRIATIQKILNSSGKITVQLNEHEEELKQLILNGETVGARLDKELVATRLKSLFTKMILDYLAFTSEGQKDAHSIIAASLFMFMKQGNAEVLKIMRDGDLQFSQILDVFGLTRSITVALSKLETGKDTLRVNVFIKMLLQGNYEKVAVTQQSKMMLLHRLDEHAPFSQILKRLFK